MNNLAIIPARKGSKRLPRKNVLPIDGKPLICYTIEAVVASAQFDTIIVSSDDEEVLETASSYSQVTTEFRDVSLAGDKVKVIDLIKSIADRPGYVDRFDLIGLMLPTCPFRTAEHIRNGIGLLSDEDFSVVSVCEMQDPVQLSLSINPDSLVMNPEALFSPSPLVTGETRSQDFEQYYRVNGGFYISWIKKFVQKKNFFQGQVKAFEMPALHSVDIDYEIDILFAELLLSRGLVSLPSFE